MEKTSIGLDENIAGLLSYVIVWVSGLVIYLLETENKFVRFHALQSIITFGSLMVVGIVLGWIPVVGAIIGWAISVLSFILWIVLMVKAYQGVKYKLPVVGDIVEKRIG